MTKAHSSLAVGEITYPLQLGVNEMVALEQLFDLPVNGVLQRITNPETLRIGDLAKVLAATVQDDGKPIDFDRGLAIADKAGLPATMRAVTDLLADLLKSRVFGAAAEGSEVGGGQ